MLLGSLWPKANTALIGFVHNDLTPRLREALPGVFHRLHFSRFTLGENVPEFGPIEVLRHAENHVQIELEMRYFSDVDVLLDAGGGGLTIGISHLKFVGRLCLSLKPLVETWPVVGGVHMFFCNQPRVELKFRGLAMVAEFPGFAEKVQDVVDDFFRDRMVLPNCRSYWYTRDEKIVNLTEGAAHEPIGVLRARVVRARNLAGVNWTLASVDRFTSDPYCILKFGVSSSRTSTIPKTCSPEWFLAEPSSYFVIHHAEQGLEINVTSEDNGMIRRGVGVHLGRMPRTSVRTMLREWPVLRTGHQEIRTARVVLDRSKVNLSMLHMQDPVLGGVPSELDIEVELFELASQSSVPRSKNGYGQDPAAVLMVELRNGSGFPDNLVSDKQGFRWRCVVEQESMLSKRGEVRKDEVLEYDVALDPRLYGVVNRLLERGLPYSEIADIVDAEVSTIARYTRLRQDDLEKALGRHRSQDENTTDLLWHQVLPILVRKPSDASLVIELLNGQSMVVGCLKPIVVQDILLDKDLSFAARKCRLQPPDHTCGQPEGLAAWLFPSCHKPTLAKSRYYHVEMEISVRLRFLTSATSCQSFDAASDNTVTTGLGSAVIASSNGGGSSSTGSELRHEPFREFGAVAQKR
eukprot:CAMPEP_0169299200 /NCGR_PEP_ID=MMETSP1016-20121227/66926_1 /TAXON_ID=342587 /ORGANISM="Karlodinium micrum, Strain CCMP2283" /LENGTH=633 /DNA_ID=CAMNT_0009391401 /DNA_START=275 /DNA_END=2172 /DNA_ORIENTATION=-